MEPQFDDLDHVIHQRVTLSFVHHRDVTGRERATVENFAIENLMMREPALLHAVEGARADDRNEIHPYQVGIMNVPLHRTTEACHPLNGLVPLVPWQSKTAPRMRTR